MTKAAPPLESETHRPCRICGSVGNRIVASESPCTPWGGIAPWMPEGHYTEGKCSACKTRYVDSDVTEEYLVNLQSADRSHKIGLTTYEATDDLDAIRKAELSEHWDLMGRVRPPKQNDRLLDYGSAWGAFGAAAMRDEIIPNGVALHPSSDLAPCVGKVHEQGLVQQLVANAAVKARDIAGLPRWAMIWVSSRATRCPEIKAPGTIARHSRVTSSTTLSTRNRLPDAIWSCAKSRLQRCFGKAGTGLGTLVPTARVRLCRRLTAKPYSR